MGTDIRWIGDVADPEARRLDIYGEHMDVFSAGAEVLPPAARETFRFWEDNWSGHGRLSGVFPRLYALSMDPGASVQQAWHRAWAPALPEALSDQRVAELLRLQ